MAVKTGKEEEEELYLTPRLGHYRLRKRRFSSEKNWVSYSYTSGTDG